jgi:hypothetical protein
MKIAISPIRTALTISKVIIPHATLHRLLNSVPFEERPKQFVILSN